MIPPAAMQTIAVMNDTTPATLRDTLAVKGKKTPKEKGRGSVSTEGNGYTSISTHTNNDGPITIVETDAIAAEGTHYTFKKINGNLVELTVNGVGIPNEAYKEYYAAIEKVEMAQHRNMEEAMARHRADQQQQRLDQEEKRRNIALQAEMRQQKQILTKKMDKEIKKADEHMRLMDDQQNQASDRELLEQKKQIMEMKRQRDSLSRVIDAAIRKAKVAPFAKTAAFQYQWQVDKQKQWQRDSITYAIKAEAAKTRAAADKIRLQVSVNIIKNIIADLAKENIIVDIDHSWFGLDAKQFIVDGKPITGEIYEKFKAKYLKIEGMGYYYGPVQVSGRGVFLDKEALGK
ncbi:hypothetical protein F5148DRAFT_1155101 [Russula earlei]|uniref:Uncharacterized protein n=1 Tax=Russula earlei TaxID=71964 RepID=A0ACC0TQH0_9AGAM|nr:hypothetical protein F5148DRAFT_1155101 [Russula earlei]